MIQRDATVGIYDDNEESRTGFSYLVEDAELIPQPADGPVGSLSDVLGALRASDVVLSDYELRARNYASFTGAELVAAKQQSGTPAILCTKYEKPQVERIRPYRRWIPALFSPEELDPDLLWRSIELCVGEINGDFVPERQPWRALVHFVENDPEVGGRYFVDIPSWGLGKSIPVRTQDLPDYMHPLVHADFRCHAMVNLGGEKYEDIFFDGWEGS